MSKINAFLGYYAIALALGMDGAFARPPWQHKEHDREKEDLPATKEYYLKKAAEKRRRKLERLAKLSLTAAPKI